MCKAGARSESRNERIAVGILSFLFRSQGQTQLLLFMLGSLRLNVRPSEKIETVPLPTPVQGLTSMSTLRSATLPPGPVSVNRTLQKTVLTSPFPVRLIPFGQFLNR